MSEIQVVGRGLKCWTPGCPEEFSISLYIPGEKDSVSLQELLDAAEGLGWLLVGDKAYCPDCQKRRTT